MAPLTTPACGPPISRQTAQAGATPSAARPAAAARNHAERIGLGVSTAAVTAIAASGKPTRPGARAPAAREQVAQPPAGEDPGGNREKRQCGEPAHVREVETTRPQEVGGQPGEVEVPAVDPRAIHHAEREERAVTDDEAPG